MVVSAGRRSLSLALAAAFLIGTISANAHQDPAPNFTGEGLPDGPGKDVMVKVCAICHEPRRAASVRLTREGWSDVIQDMMKRGAKGTDDDFVQVLEYLTTNFLGEAPRPVNINTSAAIDLESVIGLLRRESAALIAYRQKNGAFKKLEDIKKVPGVDYKKIEAAKDRIFVADPIKSPGKLIELQGHGPLLRNAQRPPFDERALSVSLRLL